MSRGETGERTASGEDEFDDDDREDGEMKEDSEDRDDMDPDETEPSSGAGAAEGSAPLEPRVRRLKLPALSTFRGFPNMAAVKLFADIASAARRVRLDQSQQHLRRRFVTFLARIKLQARTLAEVAANCCAALPDCLDRDIPFYLASTEAAVNLCPNRPTAQSCFCAAFNEQLKLQPAPMTGNTVGGDDDEVPVERQAIAESAGAVRLAEALGRRRRGYLDEHEARLAGSWRSYKERIDLRSAACAAACASVILVDLPLC